MSVKARWILGCTLAVFMVAVPFFHYRWNYSHAKRLRVVTSGKLYRSGELTAAGFREAIAGLHIRTVVNLQDEFPDPQLPEGYIDLRTIRESLLCEEMGVRYVHIAPDLLPRQRIPAERPVAIDRFLQLLDDPTVYPVLIHCKAGLHRTGVMAAVYRMEHCGWNARQAIDELKDNGFGDYACTSANDYIKQYILTFQPGQRRGTAVARDR